jgi:hypothetical protein
MQERLEVGPSLGFWCCFFVEDRDVDGGGGGEAVAVGSCEMNESEGH